MLPDSQHPTITDLDAALSTLEPYPQCRPLLERLGIFRPDVANLSVSFTHCLGSSRLSAPIVPDC